MIKTEQITMPIEEEVTSFTPRMISVTDFVMPMMPSPRIIIVRRPTRSMRWVRLKLKILHCAETRSISMASTTVVTYHPISAWAPLSGPKANVIPKYIIALEKSMAIIKATGNIVFL